MSCKPVRGAASCVTNQKFILVNNIYWLQVATSRPLGRSRPLSLSVSLSGAWACWGGFMGETRDRGQLTTRLITWGRNDFH